MTAPQVRLLTWAAGHRVRVTGATGTLTIDFTVMTRAMQDLAVSGARASAAFRDLGEAMRLASEELERSRKGYGVVTTNNS